MRGNIFSQLFPETNLLILRALNCLHYIFLLIQYMANDQAFCAGALCTNLSLRASLFRCKIGSIIFQKKIGSITLQLLQIYGSNHTLVDGGRRVMPKGGLEPPRPFEHNALNVACLPISPLRLRHYITVSHATCQEDSSRFLASFYPRLLRKLMLYSVHMRPFTPGGAQALQ